MSEISPGWYVDPSAPPHLQPGLRWWDGTGWTHHVTPAPPAVLAQAGPTTSDGVPLSGWGWRVLAYLLDTVIVAIPNALATLPAQLDLQHQLQELTRRLDATAAAGGTPDFNAFFSDYFGLYRSHAVGLFLPGIAIITAYFSVMWRLRGASAGQLVAGLRVRPVDHPGRLGWPAIGIRITVLYLLPTVLSIIGLVSGSWVLLVVLLAVLIPFQLLNVLWPLWDKRRQALHDKAAGTVVVRPVTG